MRFGEVLRSLRTDINMTQKELADRLSLSPSTIGMYEQNRRVPDAEMLSKIAFIFGVSVDYLLGENSNYEPKANMSFLLFNNSAWSECINRIRKRLLELKINEFDFCSERKIDLNEAFSSETFLDIARTLDVSTDYLLGVSDVENVSSADILFAQSLSAREVDLVESFRLLNKDNQDIIVGELKKCLKEQRYESVAADQPHGDNDSKKLYPSSGTEGIA